MTTKSQLAFILIPLPRRKHIIILPIFAKKCRFNLIANFMVTFFKKYAVSKMGTKL